MTKMSSRRSTSAVLDVVSTFRGSPRTFRAPPCRCARPRLVTPSGSVCKPIVSRQSACFIRQASSQAKDSSLEAEGSDGTSLKQLKPRKKKEGKMTILASQLPGLSAGPALGAWDAIKGRSSNPPRLAKSPSPVLEVPPVDDEGYQAAVDVGRIPDTDLSRVIWKHWQRFPGCVVLTRVGKFYESYYEKAPIVSNLIGTKMVYKRFTDKSKTASAGKTRLFAFTGFPFTHLDKYLKILVQDHGQTVVLVEEYANERVMDDYTGMVPRRVGRVITPGTLMDESWLSGGESRYLLAISVGESEPTPVEEAEREEGDATEKTSVSLAYTDVSTGEYFVRETTLAYIEDELARISPREVVLDKSLEAMWDSPIVADDEELPPTKALMDLLRVFGIHVSFADTRTPPELEGLSFPSALPSTDAMSLETQALTLLRHHLQYALRDGMPRLPSEPHRMFSERHMQIDAATLHALEVRHALRPGSMVMPTGMGPAASPLSVRGTLLSVLNRTVTASGHRLLIRTLTAPFTDLRAINSRLALVQALHDRDELREDLQALAKQFGDIMRLVQRFRSQRGDRYDVWETAGWIRSTGKLLQRIREELESENENESKDAAGTVEEGKQRLQEFMDEFTPLEEIAEMIEGAIDEEMMAQPADEDGETRDALLGDSDVESAQAQIKSRQNKDWLAREDDLWWLKSGVSPTITRLHGERALLTEEMYRMQDRLRERFDIKNPKQLVLNKSDRHGWHVVLTKKSDYNKLNKDSDFEPIYETKGSRCYAYNAWSALGAKRENVVQTLYTEQTVAFRAIRDKIAEWSELIQHNAELVDELDLAMGFAQVAIECDYVRPILNDSTEMKIVNGRHPAVESGLLASSRLFTPNSTTMSPKSHLHVITGPNQGGKSTLLRQTAVIAILAQSGSFVPAEHAELGIVDKVFSRVGARDDLFRDRSTFMLEMVETAAILRHATERSLVIMDEIGRGTTLHAGVSIAYATLDHILNHIKCRTLFATHYHELAHMLGASKDARQRSKRQRGVRKGVEFWCTDIDQVADGAFSYSYKLQPGVNHDSHAIKAARLAGMPESFLQVAEDTLASLEASPVQVKPHSTE
ncbi:muts domain V-domain-containing protein [Naematelia encephala]|uniref:DNA mismatch repair protein n=1 Tax=Naematelia encephala TaxID=71784 RepID=A0A1Y2BHS5_9TREE|nr:muts domain V-domain-containing protein [Naematelia encephala]